MVVGGGRCVFRRGALVSLVVAGLSVVRVKCRWGVCCCRLTVRIVSDLFRAVRDVVCQFFFWFCVLVISVDGVIVVT